MTFGGQGTSGYEYTEEDKQKRVKERKNITKIILKQ